MLKHVQQLRLPDPYYSGEAGVIGTTLEQLHRDMSKLELPASVPDVVRRYPRCGSCAASLMPRAYLHCLQPLCSGRSDPPAARLLLCKPDHRPFRCSHFPAVMVQVVCGLGDETERIHCPARRCGRYVAARRERAAGRAPGGRSKHSALLPPRWSDDDVQHPNSDAAT
jgi:hypothetical protein